MNIELCNTHASTEDEYWKESSLFWMKMFIKTKKELQVYKEREKVRTKAPKLKLVSKMV